MIERPVADHLAERSKRSVESASLMGSGVWVKVRWGSREKRGAGGFLLFWRFEFLTNLDSTIQEAECSLVIKNVALGPERPGFKS